MATTVRNVPRYTKVLDVSGQTADPTLDFTNGKGERLSPSAVNIAVPAPQYTETQLESAAKAEKALIDERDALQVERDQLLARLAELEAKQKAAGQPAEGAKATPEVSPSDGFHNPAGSDGTSAATETKKTGGKGK